MRHIVFSPILKEITFFVYLYLKKKLKHLCDPFNNHASEKTNKFISTHVLRQKTPKLIPTKGIIRQKKEKN